MVRLAIEMDTTLEQHGILESVSIQCSSVYLVLRLLLSLNSYPQEQTPYTNNRVDLLLGRVQEIPDDIFI